jgi:hypothetical protein
VTDHREIVHLISSFRFALTDEKKLQAEMEGRFKYAGLDYRREVRLDPHNIIDFTVGEIGIEVKIKGARLNIYKQVERYMEFDVIKRLLLVTNIPMGLPELVNGKPVHVVNLARAWL